MVQGASKLHGLYEATDVPYTVLLDNCCQPVGLNAIDAFRTSFANRLEKRALVQTRLGVCMSLKDPNRLRKVQLSSDITQSPASNPSSL